MLHKSKLYSIPVHIFCDSIVDQQGVYFFLQNDPFLNELASCTLLCKTYSQGGALIITWSRNWPQSDFYMVYFFPFFENEKYVFQAIFADFWNVSFLIFRKWKKTMKWTTEENSDWGHFLDFKSSTLVVHYHFGYIGISHISKGVL